MADRPREDGGLTATQLFNSLEMSPLCDPSDVEGLTPEQLAALHAFLHEIIAAYYRMTILVPPDQALVVLDKRFKKAAGAPRRPRR
jgi:hypothetical protein